MAEEKDAEPDDKEQYERFIETARLLEIEENKNNNFEKLVDTVIKKIDQ